MNAGWQRPLTESEAARMTRWGVKVLRYLQRTGEGPRVFMFRNRPHYLRADVLAWLETHPWARPLSTQRRIARDEERDRRLRERDERRFQFAIDRGEWPGDEDPDDPDFMFWQALENPKA